MEKLGILGCGTMGHSIALTAVWSGLPVKPHGINSAETEKAQLAVINKLRVLSENGLLGLDTIEPIKNRISIQLMR